MVLPSGINKATGLAAARVSVSAHYSSDVLGGVLLGAAVVGGWALLTRLRRSEAVG